MWATIHAIIFGSMEPRANRRKQFKILLAVFIILGLAANLRADTDAAAKVLARVALLSDPHVNRATNGDAANFKARFEKAIAQVNAAKVDIVLIAGDLTQ